jgi:histone acetyltransferase HTATIP
VPGSRLILSRDLERPRPKKTAPTPAPGKAPRTQTLLKEATSNAAYAASSTPAAIPSFEGSSASPSPGPSSLKRKLPHDEEQEEEEKEPEEEDADGDGEMDVEGEEETFDLRLTEPAPKSAFRKEQEIGKLRTSGSMTQSVSEIARVKNLNRLQIGKHEVEAWYFSPYPKEYAHLPVLYICEFCLSFFPSPMMLSRHRLQCNILHPPGNEIYRSEDISFYEIDGKRQLTWCRNLSLLSKCFLDQ